MTTKRELMPMGNRVLIIEDEVKEDNVLGLMIPEDEDTKEPSNSGVVISVGEGFTIENGTVIPPNLKNGDKIIYKSFSGSPFILENQKYLILNVRDILAKVK